MGKLLYVGIGGLQLEDRTVEFFHQPSQVRAGLSRHFVLDLTAHCLLKRVGKEGKPEKASMYVRKRVSAPLASPSQTSRKARVSPLRPFRSGLLKTLMPARPAKSAPKTPRYLWTT